MSHVITSACHVTDLDVLEVACKAIGLELVRGQKQFRWWGHHVGDYPIPEGYTQDDLGKCEHAIRIPGKPDAYEIGVVQRRDGQEGWSLMFDFYGGGRGMQAVAGLNCEKVAQQYAIATAEALYPGWIQEVTFNKDGSMTLEMTA
jgi:hypothetical protein